MAHGAETVKTKEIVFDASSALLHRGTGIGTYTRSLAAALKEKYDGEVELLLPLAPREEDLFCEGESEDRSQRLGRFLKENKARLCHIPQNGLGLPAETAHRRHQNGARADAVTVIVPEDDDRPPLADKRQNHLDGGGNAGKRHCPGNAFQRRIEELFARRSGQAPLGHQLLNDAAHVFR